MSAYIARLRRAAVVLPKRFVRKAVTLSRADATSMKPPPGHHSLLGVGDSFQCSAHLGQRGRGEGPGETGREGAPGGKGKQIGDRTGVEPA